MNEVLTGRPNIPYGPLTKSDHDALTNSFQHPSQTWLQVEAHIRGVAPQAAGSSRPSLADVLIDQVAPAATEYLTDAIGWAQVYFAERSIGSLIAIPELNFFSRYGVAYTLGRLAMRAIAKKGEQLSKSE